MKDSEIKTMNRSFRKLEDRRAKILDDEHTLKLKKNVKAIREHSIANIEQLIRKATEKLEANDIEVIYAEKSENALEAIILLKTIL